MNTLKTCKTLQGPNLDLNKLSENPFQCLFFCDGQSKKPITNHHVLLNQRTFSYVAISTLSTGTASINQLSSIPIQIKIN